MATVANAVVNATAATAVGAARRANGECFTACPVGTVCNQRTGACDELPCRGRCGFNEVCDTSTAFHRCVPGNGTQLKLEAGASAPSRSGAPPSDAPTATDAPTQPSSDRPVKSP